MKIIAKIIRADRKSFVVEQPYDAPDVPESIIRRHIGPRPWCETFSVNDVGNKISGYHRAGR